MHQYIEVALPEEGSVPNTTPSAGGTAFTSATKPKSKATGHTSVMRLGSSIVERARVRVGVGERVCASAMTAQKRL
jgi:acyl-coenzyme A thioesterase PaaI-like protein